MAGAVSDPVSGPAGDPGAAIAARLAQLWRTSRPTIFERLAVLKTAHAALVANAGDAAQRGEAREAAHKLSGVLGIFGLPQGSELAHHLEERLKSADALTASDLIAMAGEIESLEALIAAKGEG
jgi:HPt (histidine-containing phosphotransfer) domain-containing protein